MSKKFDIESAKYSIESITVENILHLLRDKQLISEDETQSVLTNDESSQIPNTI